MAVNLNSAILSSNSVRTASFYTTPATNAPAQNVVDQNGNPLPQAPTQPQSQQTQKTEVSFNFWETLKSAWPIVAGFVGITFLVGLASAFVNHRSNGGFVNKKSAETIAREGLNFTSKLNNVEKSALEHLQTFEEYKDLSDEKKKIIIDSCLERAKVNSKMSEAEMLKKFKEQLNKHTEV